MNELLHRLAEHLPGRVRSDRQGRTTVYSVCSEGTWLPVYRDGPTSGWWVHGERHLEYGLREEAELRGTAWQLHAEPTQAHVLVSATQRMCSGEGQTPVHNLACGLLDMLEQPA